MEQLNPPITDKQTKKLWQTPQCTRKSWQTPQIVALGLGATKSGGASFHESIVSAGSLSSS
jgi:hypothetical protein